MEDRISVHAQGKIPMSDYRIERVGTRFTVIDPLDTTYPTEEAAKQDIGRCKKEEWVGADWL